MKQLEGPRVHRSAPGDRRAPLAMVYGGGGVFGIAYTSGVAQGLADRGMPIRQAPSLGTSAGSWTAAALALGLSYDDFDDLRPPPVPTRRTGVLADIALHRQRLRPGSADQAGGFLRRAGAAGIVDDHQPRAVLRRAHRDGPAKPGRTAGDQHHGVFIRSYHRLSLPVRPFEQRAPPFAQDRLPFFR